MTTLHVYFALRNQQAFQRLLDVSRAAGASTAPALSSSGGRSWNKPSPLSSNAPSTCDVNARDWLGRTVLHLAVSSPDSAALEYVKLVLTHPRIDINMADTESRWTPLHRALYSGNLAASVLLLQRAEIDISLKDFEGCTAFDLYNSTVKGTKPDDSEAADLFTWGTNRNAALGLGDGDDRAHPEQVQVPPQDERPVSQSELLSVRFQPIRVRQVAMAKLHTAIVTAEPRANLRLCGFGSGGRLGPAQHTQYNLTPLNDLNEEAQIVALALGQDHTLALTRAGDVLSWGLARFSQLGYPVEGATLQSVPRRVVGPLKREFVKGVAACRTASVCWTATELYTWGTNGGQLGYDRAAQPVQILPRRVTQITQPVVGVAISDAAMACLLESQDIICFYNGRNFKINFPTQNFPSEIQAYRPPMAQNNASIAKVVCCDFTFAALSSNGELFTFTLNPPSSADMNATQNKVLPGAATVVRPQRVWALRKQFSAVKDVALGADGTIILCTESGHVYVRSRTAKVFKFQRIPFMQRIISVAANSAGAFAALRTDSKPAPIEITGNTVAGDLEAIQPYLALADGKEQDVEAGYLSTTAQVVSGETLDSARSPIEEMDVEEDVEDSSIKQDINTIQQLLDVLIQDAKRRRIENEGLFGGTGLKHGADLLVRVNTCFEFPVHKAILASRSSVLKDVLLGKGVKNTSGTPTVTIGLEKISSVSVSKMQKPLPTLTLSGVHPLSVLLLSVYLYTDVIPAIWDRRVAEEVIGGLAKLRPKMTVSNIRSELQVLAKLLCLSALDATLSAPVKRDPASCMGRDMRALFDAAQPSQENKSSSSIQTTTLPLDPLAPDIILELEDAHVYCHSVVLRARSSFFASFLNDTDWTVERWKPDTALVVNMRHMRWRVMGFVIRFIYSGGGEEMFEVLDFAQNVDDVLEFIFEVMDVASELLLDRLLLVCSSVILKYININNVCCILSDATHFHATHLIASLQGYMARNMETLLESRTLDDLADLHIRQLSTFVRACQMEKLPVTRSGTLVNRALENCKDWLALQDIPQPFVPGRRGGLSGHARQSPKLSPTQAGSKRNGRPLLGHLSPTFGPSNGPRSTLPPTATSDGTVSGPDDIFVMDDDVREDIPPLSLPAGQINDSSIPTTVDLEPPTGTYSPWKAKANQQPPRMDLRTIMAEAEGQRSTPFSSGTPPGRSRVIGFNADPSSSMAISKTPQKALSTAEAHRDKTNSPWRLPTSRSTLPLPADLSSPSLADSLKNTPPSGISRALRTNEGMSSKAASSPSLTASSPAQASPSVVGKAKAPLGPTFTPGRHNTPIATPMSRRVSEGSGNPWVAPVLYAPEPNPSASASPQSFLVIQQQQRAQDTSSTKVKKSLLEIQVEEQARQEAEKAEQEEVEFMLWWAAEEERIRRETQAQPGPPVSVPGSGKGRGGGRKAKATKKVPGKETAVNASPSQTVPQAQGRAQTKTRGSEINEHRRGKPRRAKGKESSQPQQV
ncbi:hypothetical protein M0805_007759 [Coniferiporia weirii]|nr:hypothetical protein M0805_007759 [Coniferiporia weirii]